MRTRAGTAQNRFDAIGHTSWSALQHAATSAHALSVLARRLSWTFVKQPALQLPKLLQQEHKPLPVSFQACLPSRTHASHVLFVSIIHWELVWSHEVVKNAVDCLNLNESSSRGATIQPWTPPT